MSAAFEKLLEAAKKKFDAKHKNNVVKFQLGKFELPPTGLLLNNPLKEKMYDRRYMVYGRAKLFYGRKGNAKTSLMFDDFKDVQRAGGDAIWIETEHAPDLDYAAKQGVNIMDNFSIQHPSTLEQGLDLVKFYVSLYTDQYPEGNGPPLIIGFDSIAGTMTDYEAENDAVADVKVGNHAKLMGQFYRKIIEDLDTENIIFIATNQLKDKIGGMTTFGGEPGEAMLGGDGPRFHSTYQIKAVRIKNIVKPNKYGVDRKVGSIHEFTTHRNKLGREGNSEKVRANLWIEGGMDWFTPLAEDMGANYPDVVKAAGQWHSWRIAGTPYIHTEYDDGGQVKLQEEREIPSEKAMSAEKLGQIIRASNAAMDVCRERYEIPELPAPAIFEEVAKENKKNRAIKKKKKLENGDDDDEAPKVL